jgi:hypothetical protein
MLSTLDYRRLIGEFEGNIHSIAKAVKIGDAPQTEFWLSTTEVLARLQEQYAAQK